MRCLLFQYAGTQQQQGFLHVGLNPHFINAKASHVQIAFKRNDYIKKTPM
jgi:hypothetical protein